MLRYATLLKNLAYLLCFSQPLLIITYLKISGHQDVQDVSESNVSSNGKQLDHPSHYLLHKILIHHAEI